jgi:hypothetical protein
MKAVLHELHRMPVIDINRLAFVRHVVPPTEKRDAPKEVDPEVLRRVQCAIRR